MTSLDGIPLSEYFLKTPTIDERRAYHAARRPALADPLERGVVVDWNGPNLRPETLPSDSYPHNHTPEPSPNSPRPLLHSLLDPGSPSQGGAGWSLKLVEPVQVGEDEQAQIWSAKQPPTAVFLPTKAATSLSATDSTRFVLTCGETSVGVVLEDLVEQTIPLSTWFSREAIGKRLSFPGIIPIAFELFQLQHRINDCRILDLVIHFDDVFVLRGSSVPPHFVVMGFSDSMPYEIAERLVAEDRAEKTEEVLARLGNPPLVQDDQGRLACCVEEITWPLGKAFTTWMREEPEGQRFVEGLPFLSLL
ncbi:hypothetical protein JCM6882_007729 [Rhodosporidiobolus microsporus]